MRNKTIFETDKYTIKEIPLNYRIDIKPSMVLKDKNTGIERDWYWPLDWGKQPLESVKQVAEEACKDYFRPRTPEEQREAEKKAESMRRMRFVKRNR